MATTARKLGGFGLAAAALFAVAYGAGHAIGPVAAEPRPDAGHAMDSGRGAGMGTGGHGEMRGDSHGAGVPKGVLISADGLTLDVRGDGPRAGARTDFAFRVLDDRGAPVTRFAPTHDKRMHLVVVRRDLSGFQHLHPTMSADGTWRVPLTIATAGDYRVFADFLPAGRAEGTTLGADVPVTGAYRPEPLPAPSRTATVDGYRVTLSGTLTPGTTSRLTLRIDRGGEPVTDLQPYLAAYGHLIALRQGDLAYLHVHPDEAATPGPSITFHAEVPSAGTYRLYLDFKHGDAVHTAELTAVAAAHGSHGSHGEN
jgi:hypothetical protein